MYFCVKQLYIASSILAQGTHTPFIPCIHARLIPEVNNVMQSIVKYSEGFNFLIIIYGIMHTCTKLCTTMTDPIMNNHPFSIQYTEGCSPKTPTMHPCSIAMLLLLYSYYKLLNMSSLIITVIDLNFLLHLDQMALNLLMSLKKELLKVFPL